MIFIVKLCKIYKQQGLVAELVDATDLKSVNRKIVGVRVPPCPRCFYGVDAP